MSKFDYRLRRIEEQSNISSTDTADAIMSSLSEAELKTFVRDIYEEKFRQFKKSNPELARRYADLCDWTEVELNRLPPHEAPSKKRMTEIHRKLEKASDLSEEEFSHHEAERMQEYLITASDEAHFQLTFLDYLEKREQPIIESLAGGEILEFCVEDGRPIAFAYLAPKKRQRFQEIVFKSTVIPEKLSLLQDRHFDEKHVQATWAGYCKKALFAFEGRPFTDPDEARRRYLRSRHGVAQSAKRTATQS